jgi:hypothetical protein
MNIFNFHNAFPTEDACRQYIREKREQQGITCKRCKCTKHYWMEAKQLWRCADCESTTNLRADTIMMKSKVPILTWFQCIHLMTSTKKSMSALEMQRQLQMKRYEPVWYMMQKVRISMGKRDDRYKLSGHIELDDSFFETVDLTQSKYQDNPQSPYYGQMHRGRHKSSRQKTVLVMVESTPNPKQKNPNKKKRIMGFVKMVTIDTLNSIAVNYEVQKSVNQHSIVTTDSLNVLKRLPEVVDKHIYEKTEPTEAHEKLPWVHTMISNAKRQLVGVHHSIGKKYLQNYLNEFCYKLNRRTFHTDLFDRVMQAGVSDTWY